MADTDPSPADLVRAFYAARAAGEPDALRPFLADNVRWREPDVGDHMGELNGVDAVLDMIARAMATTAGTFSLAVADVVEIAGHCAAVIEWSAQKGESQLNGRELAVFSIQDGRITAAQFLPEDLADDTAFWT